MSCFDFYNSGIVVPLFSASLIAQCIAGSVVETLEIEKLADELKETMTSLLGEQKKSVDSVVRYLSQLLRLRDRRVTQLNINAIYRMTPERVDNVLAWFNAENIGEGKSKVTPTTGP